MRFHQFGFRVGALLCGKKHSIADVRGVTVGHSTIKNGTACTGVTVINPGVTNLFRNKLPAAVFVANGFGKMTGTTQIEELGTLETPIALTNTLAVGPVTRGLVDLVIKNTPDLQPTETVNAVVGETNDGYLNDIHADVVKKSDVSKAFENCSADFAVGAVGAGTGTRAFSWKGGIGTASRVLTINGKNYTLGVLIQTNYGGTFTMLGVPIGEILGVSDFDFVKMSLASNKKPDGSCIIVVATDAPLSARQLKRIAQRAFFGVVRTGSVASHGSGDYIVAFSTSRAGVEGAPEKTRTSLVSDSELNQFFVAAADATEESVYDAIFAAETTKGRNGNILESLPKTQIIEILTQRFHEN